MPCPLTPSGELMDRCAEPDSSGGAPAIGEHISPRAFQRFVRRALGASGASGAPPIGADRVPTVLFPRVRLKGLSPKTRLNGRVGYGSFGVIWGPFLTDFWQLYHRHPPRAPCAIPRLCVADWCLQSDGML